MQLLDSVQCLKGVGAARAKQLHSLGIDTLYDLITYFPREYEDRSQMLPICELEVDMPACFRAMVVSHVRTDRVRQGLELTRVQVADGTARLNLVFFNQSYLKDFLEYGQEYYFYGKVSGDFGGYQMTNPVVERVTDSPTATRCIVPIYSLTAGLNNRLLSRTVAQGLAVCREAIPEVLPEAVRSQYGLMDCDTAYRTVHRPSDFEALEAARRRILFEEFFIYSLGLVKLRRHTSARYRPPMEELDLTPFLSALPFSLTRAQSAVIREIAQELGGSHPMARLVQGDVGSGKTMVAAAAIYLTARNGGQCALMAPTQILAGQHFDALSRLFAPLGISCVLLTGGMKAAARREALEALATGKAQLAIGTHALISEPVSYQNLSLVIVDEQHRFGVSQRAELARKGICAHLLVMSATPIPRTLAMMLYGDLSVSVLDELPPGREPVDTFLVDERYRQRINAFLRKQVAAGHQCYIICPAVEESDSLKSAQVWAQTLQTAVFPDLRIALLHGKMTGTEKEEIMGAFAQGQTDILVATTVVEVGMDVPNATVMVVENADRFGLSQLHQLRGRVGRGRDKSYCILISSAQSAETRRRLKTLCQTNDGFLIAKEDLRQRGPGDLFGSRQSGLPVFRSAGFVQEVETLQNARNAARDFADAPLSPELEARLGALFSQNTDIFN